MTATKAKARISFGAGLGLILFALLQSACTIATTDESAAETTSTQSVETTGNVVVATGREIAVNVSIRELMATTFQSHLNVVGEVDSDYNTLLSAQSSGTLNRILRDRGSRVEQGDTLLEIDSRRAAAAHEMASAGRAIAKLDFDIAERQFEQGLGMSESDFHKVQNALRIADAQLLDAAVMLENCFLIAPFSGVVDERYARVGELVAPGMPLLRLVDNEHLKVVCGVPENQSGFLKVGQQATIRVSETGLVSSAVIHWVSAAVNKRDRTVSTELSMAPGSGLKPGMVCEVTINRGAYENAVVVPLSVIQQSENHHYVYIEDSGKAVSRRVQVADRDGTLARIADGLQLGDHLITKGFRDVVSGQVLHIVKGASE